jgi:CheY-like chemotaxis protein
MSAARVLVVDDDPLVLQTVSHMLSRAGYEVVPAGGPRQALGIVNKNPAIDLVLSDIAMPEMQGTELMRQVARISPRTERLLMTGGQVDSGDVPDGVPVIHKPFSTPELLSAVRGAVERSTRLSDGLAHASQENAELRRQKNQLLSECDRIVRQSSEIVRKSRLERERRQRRDRQPPGEPR